MLKPILITVRGQEMEVSCLHAEIWPPGWSKTGIPLESLRDQGHFTLGQYERAKTWARICGLQAMDESKCSTCPSALRPDKTPLVPPVPKAPMRLQRPRRNLR